MSDIGAVHHIGFTVRDLEASLRFYRDQLGCTVTMQQRKSGGYLAEIVGYPEATVKMAHLSPPSGSPLIELFEYVAPATIPADLEPARVGNAHICLIVDDLQEVYERLVREGVGFYSPPVDVDTGVNSGGRGAYARDPDGITIELFQPPAGESMAGAS